MILKKVNYLNNRDILSEIHRSKNSFCSFSQPEFHQYDIIVNDLGEIDFSIIDQARIARAVRLTQEAHSHQKEIDPSAKAKDHEVQPDSFALTDLIFRVMTFDHIPNSPGRKKTIASPADTKVILNFPPFQHWKFDESGELCCVGKSHWVGDVENGKFSKDHGAITDKLARMYLKLCDRYATRANVRSYTYNDEMRGNAILQLVHMGLKFDESKSSNPFSYLTSAITNAFIGVINKEKRSQTMRDDILEMNGMSPSYTRSIGYEIDAETRRNLDFGE